VAQKHLKLDNYFNWSFAAEPLSNGSLGGPWHYDCHRSADLRHLHGRRFLH